MRILDLFCGAGGAARGYAQAGFDVVGIDHKAQPSFPYDFVKADALTYLRAYPDLDRAGIVAIHASPPCQAYSVLRRANPDAEYADLIGPTREALEETGLPWVIENVPGSPTRHLTVLCGSMFGLGAVSGGRDGIERKWRQLRRHRNFETSFPMLSPPCQHEGEAIGVYGGGPFGRYTFANGAKRDDYGRRGGYQGTIAEKREAMGLPGLNGREISQAIPPAYTYLIGLSLRAYLTVIAA